LLGEPLGAGDDVVPICKEMTGLGTLDQVDGWENATAGLPTCSELEGKAESSPGDLWLIFAYEGFSHHDLIFDTRLGQSTGQSNAGSSE